MNRRIKFNTLLPVIVAGALACTSHAALALPQSSGAEATAASDPSGQVASPQTNASAPSSGIAAAEASTQSDPAQEGTSSQASASPSRAVASLYAARRPFVLQRFLNALPPGIFPRDQASSTDQGSSSHDGTEKTKHVAEDANQRDSNFPPWALYSTQNIDPRVKPNGGIRLPALFPNFSGVVPDYDRTLADTRNWSIKVSLAAFVAYVDPRSSKFGEFRDVRDGAVAGIEAHYREGAKYLNVVGRNLGRKDEDLNAEGGVAGKYILSFFDDWTPHNYMFGARSLYSGVGTGNLSISDSIRTDIQNSASMTDADTKLAGYVAQQGQSVDLGLQREKIGGDITLVKTYPWLVKLAASDESRDGERPWSGSFGFSDFVEIPWAVHYDTDEIRLNAEWTKPESRVYFTAGFRASLFDNHVTTQTFSNPFRITDGANLVGSYDGGPAMGRMALYPSNESYEPSAMLVVKQLPWDSTLSATFAAAFGYQNQRLLPFSTNTADIVSNTAGASFNATDPAALPRQTANASINSQNLQLRWTAKPFDHLHVNTEYRVFRNDVTTPRFIIANFVREDQDVREPQSFGDTFSSLPIGYTRQTGTITADYDFGHDNRLAFTYTFEGWDRRYREVKYMDDNRIRVSYDTKAKKWLDLKSWYEHTIRTASQYQVNQWHIHQGDGDENTALLQIRKMDEAPYIKDDIQIMATVQLGSDMSISAHLLGGKTNFNHQTFGVINNSHQSYGVDYSYDATDRLSFFADYSYEKFHNRLYDRTWTPGDPCDPYSNGGGYASPCNWGGVPEDAYNTAGVGLDAYLIPKRLHWLLYYTFSKSHGTQSYFGGGGPDNPFVPTNSENVDSVTYNAINQEMEYKFTKTIALDAGYQYELWLDKDYNYNGFSYVNQFAAFNFIPLPGTNLLMGGLLPPEYHANVAYFRLKFGF